jgi:hypothetical protein
MYTPWSPFSSWATNIDTRSLRVGGTLLPGRTPGFLLLVREDALASRWNHSDEEVTRLERVFVGEKLGSGLILRS